MIDAASSLSLICCIFAQVFCCLLPIASCLRNIASCMHMCVLVCIHIYVKNSQHSSLHGIANTTSHFPLFPSPLQHSTCLQSRSCFCYCIVRSGSRSFMAQLFSFNPTRWCRYLAYLLDSPLIYVALASICRWFFNFLAFTLVYLFQLFEMRFCIDWLWRVCTSRVIFFSPILHPRAAV